MPTTTRTKSKPTFRDVYATLKSLGTEQNIKIYKRHGASDPMFGVSFANLNKLKKQIKVDHDIALKLWNTGNMDAMVLATIIADPEQVTEDLIDDWLNDLDYAMTTDYFVTGVVMPTPHAKKKMQAWTKSSEEFVKRAGYSILANLAKRDADSLTDKQFEAHLKRIQRDIHDAPNRAREAMNSALIAIGRRNPHLHKLALAAAKRIGPVIIEHGEKTNCKDVDAVERLSNHQF